MQKKFFLSQSGQSIQKQDADLLGEVSALADDRVFAELFRLAPFAGSVAKAVLAHGHQGSGVFGLVSPGSLGHVDVRPFRALIGSRTAEATDAEANWRDIRSGLSVAEGASTRTTSLAIAANATAFSRIDLVYAALALETNGPNVDRVLKDPTTGATSPLSTAVVKLNPVTASVVQGVESATPDLPLLPSDSGGVYNIPLAYVRVPAGFGATSALTARADFHVVAPAVTLAPGSGAATLRAADKAYTPDPTKLAAWANTASTRSASYVPADLVGAESVFVVLDLTSGAESHASGDSVDASRDWRNRVSDYKGVAGVGVLPWLSSTAGLLNPELYKNGVATKALFSGMGSSFPGATATDRVVAYVDATGDGLAELPAGAFVKIYADDTTGELRVSYPTGPTHPNCKVVIRITMTGPF